MSHGAALGRRSFTSRIPRSFRLAVQRRTLSRSKDLRGQLWRIQRCRRSRDHGERPGKYEKRGNFYTQGFPASCLAAAIGSDASQIRLVRPIGFPGAAAALLFDWSVQLADVESVSLSFSCLSSWRSFTLCAKTSCGESEKPAPKCS